MLCVSSCRNQKSLGYHITHEELLEGIGFDDNIVHNGENELYAEMVMEHFHGYGCHCMPDHAHFIFAGGQGPPQVKSVTLETFATTKCSRSNQFLGYY